MRRVRDLEARDRLGGGGDCGISLAPLRMHLLEMHAQ